MLNFALPKIFHSVESLIEWFNTPYTNSGSSDKIKLNEEEALLVIRRLHKVSRPSLLRLNFNVTSYYTYMYIQQSDMRDVLANIRETTLDIGVGMVCFGR